MLDTTTSVETPERVQFRHRLAGPGSRLGAWLIDAVVQGFLYLGSVGFLLLFSWGGAALASVSAGAMLLAWFVISWFYAALLEYLWSGRTVGKWAMGLRVVLQDGAPITLMAAVLRNLMRGVDGLPAGYAIGALTTVIDPKLRRLGDIVAGTVVVLEQRSTLLGPVTLEPPVTDEERLALPLRVDLGVEERRAIEQLLRRAPQLGPHRTEELAAFFAPTLTARTGVQGKSALRTVALAWARATGHDA